MKNKYTDELINSVVEAINRYMTMAELEMTITLPEGSQEATVKGSGATTIDFYMLMAGIRPVFVQLIEDMGGVDNVDVEGLLDHLWLMIRMDCLEQLKGAAADEP